MIALADSGNWYGVKLSTETFERRFAVRLEAGADSISDPATGAASV